MSQTDQILIYIGAGLGIFNLMLPLFKIISKRTATKIDDDIIEVLEEALTIAKDFLKKAKK